LSESEEVLKLIPRRIALEFTGRNWRVRHRFAGRKLGRPTDHRLALYRNLATDLLRYEKIRTTEAKAKEVRQLAEEMITKAKSGTLHARRQVLAELYDPTVVDKLFATLAPRFQDRPGGYTRIIRIGPRKGDAAPMVQLELVI
jgi:large subunit ribosomal protein L17